ncbi:hypothetical protein OG946_29075 [Streptomyces sp. NBC_01808]|nr:hypothetical protein OG946_29075 [Streptomyces sp. NBC_01808]
MAQTTDVSRVTHFGGIYTYDAIAGANDPDWGGVAAWCRQNGYVWAPSIGPGYLDDRAVPGNTSPTVDRADGAVYDRSWGYVLDPAKGGPADWVTLTSFNEWHEGSQLERLRRRRRSRSTSRTTAPTGVRARRPRPRTWTGPGTGSPSSRRRPAAAETGLRGPGPRPAPAGPGLRCRSANGPGWPPSW